METDIKLLEEIHLSQEQGDIVRFAPRKDQRDRFQLGDMSFNDQRPCLMRREIPRQPDRGALSFPVRPQSDAKAIGHHVHDCAGVEKSMSGHGVRCPETQFQRE